MSMSPEKVRRILKRPVKSKRRATPDDVIRQVCVTEKLLEIAEPMIRGDLRAMGYAPGDIDSSVGGIRKTLLHLYEFADGFKLEGVPFFPIHYTPKPRARRRSPSIEDQIHKTRTLLQQSPSTDRALQHRLLQIIDEIEAAARGAASLYLPPEGSEDGARDAHRIHNLDELDISEREPVQSETVTDRPEERQTQNTKPLVIGE